MDDQGRHSIRRSAHAGRREGDGASGEGCQRNGALTSSSEDRGPPGITWECAPLTKLSAADLYAALQLRQRVFIVEQNCVYLDADDVDQKADHLLGWQITDGKRRLIAYARLLPANVKYAEPSIGRVVSHPDVRGSGIGKELMGEAVSRVEAAGWGSSIRIAAQMYLEKFYEGFGFRRVTEPYTEDDIWHVDMLRA